VLLASACKPDRTSKFYTSSSNVFVAQLSVICNGNFFSGASLLVYQLFIYPRINKVIGHIKASRIAAILCIPILFAYPYMTYLSGPGLTIILNIASVIKNNLGVSIFPCQILGIYVCDFQGRFVQEKGSFDI
jgi:hypothetical protein